MSENTRDILESIFASDTGFDEIDRVGLKQSPSYGEVFEFAELLSENPREEDLQVFVRDHPRFLTSLHGWADDQVLALIPKPSIGGHYFADFGILIFGQGGCGIGLVELEPADADVFTKTLSPARRYQGAISQVQDWNQWIMPNMNTFVRDMIATAKELKRTPEHSDNGGFRTREVDLVEAAWRSFGGFENPRVYFTIIIGRWSRLSDKEQSRLVSLNRTNGQLYLTYTYDQLIRRGIERPFGHW
ncbi:MAG TPA: DUF4263 domain-containing protein [Deltaproteobacteria bacterium]|nr:DUF4263 domain-containing protein [Deltaproteobacteria bacterium]HXK47170.1 DUF4263 domain-containing protein [Deltaproteobacteria bacterium]